MEELEEQTNQKRGIRVALITGGACCLGRVYGGISI